MDLDRLTTKSSEAVHSALGIATSSGAPYVEPLHLLAALLDQPEGFAGALLTAVGSSVGALRPQVVQALAQQPRASRLLRRSAAALASPGRGDRSGRGAGVQAR